MKNIKILILLLIFNLSIIVLPKVKADIGPKPTLNVNIKYNLQNDLEINLLTKKSNSFIEELYYDESLNISEDFFNYLIENSFDGYSFAKINQITPYNIKKNNDNNEFTISYRYPSTFKLIILDKTTN